MNQLSKWRILPFQVLNAFDNMAIDEAILIGASIQVIPPPPCGFTAGTPLLFLSAIFRIMKKK